MTIDYVIPISRGGGKRAYNQVGACRHRTRVKSDLIPEDYAVPYIAIYLHVLWRWSGGEIEKVGADGDMNRELHDDTRPRSR